jgi:hypothetical protein
MAPRSLAYITSAVIGFGLGVLLSLVGVVLLGTDISDQMLLGAFTIVVFLVSASLAASAKRGLVLGVFAVIAQAVIDVIYFVSVYGADLQLVPYAAGFALFVGRVPLFPLAGALGGYLGQEYFSEKSGKSAARNWKRRPRR